jgi:hypothetical protein
MRPIIALAGQSNADGRADIYSVTDYASTGLTTPYSNVRYMEKREDSPTDPLVWDLERGPIDLQARPGGNQGIFGVELTLGRTLTELGFRHDIVKTAIGSTRLDTNWRAVGSTYPSTGSTLFEIWIAHLQEAERSLGGKVVGVVWIQGESDAGVLAAANAYSSNLVALISQFRSYFPNTWWVLNRLHSLSGGTYNSTVRAQQDLVVAAVEDTAIVACDDLGLVGAHFNGDGYVTLGERFADSIFSNFESSSMFTVTAAGIRDQIYTLIEALTPASLSADKFRRYRNEGDADFDAWAEKNPAASLRRFQVREVGDDEPPLTSSTIEERVRVRFEIRMAYPQNHRYGAANGMDRDDVINADWLRLNFAIGIYGRSNFSGTNDCTPLGAVKVRESGGKVDYLVVTAEYEHVRSTT